MATAKVARSVPSRIAGIHGLRTRDRRRTHVRGSTARVAPRAVVLSTTRNFRVLDDAAVCPSLAVTADHAAGQRDTRAWRGSPPMVVGWPQRGSWSASIPR